MYIILMGMPGAGKGTQAHAIESTLQLPHITTGGLFRALKTQETPLARQVRQIMQEGGLVPDDIVIEMVRARLGEADVQKGFILDGFPRTPAQAAALDSLMAEMGKTLGPVFFLKTCDEEAVSRISGRRICTNDEDHIFHIDCNPPRKDGICDICSAPLYQREDDQVEAVKKRLEKYHAETEPVLDYYRQRDMLITVRAEQCIEDVSHDILEGLGIPVDREDAVPA